MKIQLPPIPKLKHQAAGNFLLIAGPCVIEDTESPAEIARCILDVCQELKIPFVFKASYRKGNRSRSDSFTGIGDEIALNILKKIGMQYDIPVVTDIHSAAEAAMVAPFVDMIQIPAFLCRQTDILVAAARTQKVINIKKGQFVSAETMSFAAEKVVEHSNQKVMFTERGTTFGYHDLVVDFRNIPRMQESGFPVIYDVTHSLQQPNHASGVSGGLPSMISTMACAGIAAGADGIFIETHPQPELAKSDGSNMLNLSLLPALLEKLVGIKKAIG